MPLYALPIQRIRRLPAAPGARLEWLPPPPLLELCCSGPAAAEDAFTKSSGGGVSPSKSSSSRYFRTSEADCDGALEWPVAFFEAWHDSEGANGNRGPRTPPTRCGGGAGGPMPPPRDHGRLRAFAWPASLKLRGSWRIPRGITLASGTAAGGSPVRRAQGDGASPRDAGSAGRLCSARYPASGAGDVSAPNGIPSGEGQPGAA